MSTDRKANAPGRTGPIAHELGKIRVGRLPTMNQDEYPGLSGWWVQLRIGEDGEEVLARVYGNTPEQAHSRATALAGQPGQALTQQTLDDVMAGIPARDAEIEALRTEVEALQAALAQPDRDAVDLAREGMELHSTGAPEYIVCAELVRIAESAQLVDRSTEMQRNLVDETPNLQSQQQPVSGADGLQARTDALYIALEVCSAELFAQCADQPRAMKYVEQARHALALEQCARAAAGRPAQLQPQPSGNAGEFPRLPLNDPAAAYRVLYEYGQSCARAALSQQDAMLDSRIAADMAAIVETLDEGEWAEHIAKADLGQRLERHITQLVGKQQDASKVDAALAEMVHAMFRSANSIPVTRITIDRKQYEAAIDAARKEQA